MAETTDLLLAATVRRTIARAATPMFGSDGLTYRRGRNHMAVAGAALGHKLNGLWLPAAQLQKIAYQLRLAQLAPMDS